MDGCRALMLPVAERKRHRQVLDTCQRKGEQLGTSSENVAHCIGGAARDCSGALHNTKSVSKQSLHFKSVAWQVDPVKHLLAFRSG